VGSRYESLVLDAIPPGCKRALDVGCGNGELTRELHRRGVPEIVGVDRDEACVLRCRHHPQAGDIRYIRGDLRTADLGPELPTDLPIEAAAQIVNLVRRRSNDVDGEPPAPIVWPPPERYSTMRRLAVELLPGVRWRRHLMWRYSLVWVNGGCPL
jgi:SAM-dependent methyltransferase